MIHTVKGFSIVHEAKIEVFIEFSYCNSTDIGNLISGSSAFSKSSLNIWKFSIHILLKPGLENFKHYSKKSDMTEQLNWTELNLLACEMNAIVW